jgi:hypothetical protein
MKQRSEKRKKKQPHGDKKEEHIIEPPPTSGEKCCYKCGVDDTSVRFLGTIDRFVCDTCAPQNKMNT